MLSARSRASLRRALAPLFALAITAAALPPRGAQSAPERDRAPNLSAARGLPAPSAASLDAAILEIMRVHHREGVAATVVKNGEPYLRRGWGLSDVERQRAATADTVFLTSSMSKPIMAVAVMQVLERLAEERQVSLASLLDGDVSDLIRRGEGDALRVRHPRWPDVPITVRMLLTHTSSIQNRYDAIPHDFAVTAPAYSHDHVPDLRQIFVDYLTPAGRYYHADNFLPEKPGTRYEYSSVATSLAALVVTANTSETFEGYCRTHVFDRLGLRATAFRLTDIPGVMSGVLDLAMPYQWITPATGAAHSARVEPPVWENTFGPSASLRSTATEYARMVTAFAAGASLRDERLLSAATWAEMMRLQVPDLDKTQRIIFYSKKRAGVDVVGHGGANDGFRSDMFFTVPESMLPDTTTPLRDTWGVVVLTNGDLDVADKSLEKKVGEELLGRAIRGELPRLP